jgi:hypothetical protein
MNRESGQAVIEYLLLLIILVGAASLLMRGLRDFGLGTRISEYLTTTYRSAYMYGHPQAKGFTDGGPKYHPAAPLGSGEGNGRLFINPKE